MLTPVQGSSCKGRSAIDQVTANCQNGNHPTKPATGPWLFPGPLALLQLYGWSMPQPGLLMTWCCGWLLPLACTNTLHDVILRLAPIWHLTGIQHLCKSSLESRARHHQCCPSIYCSLQFAHWCLLLRVPTTCPTWPHANPANHKETQIIIDNVAMAAGDQHIPFLQLVVQAQHQLQWWNQLVQSSDSVLNPQKCCCAFYYWQPD